MSSEQESSVSNLGAIFEDGLRAYEDGFSHATIVEHTTLPSGLSGYLVIGNAGRHLAWEGDDGVFLKSVIDDEESFFEPHVTRTLGRIAQRDQYGRAKVIWETETWAFQVSLDGGPKSGDEKLPSFFSELMDYYSKRSEEKHWVSRLEELASKSAEHDAV